MGGHVCDCSGNEIIYDRKDKSNGYVNANGNIGLFDRNLYDCFLEFSSKSKKEAC